LPYHQSDAALIYWSFLSQVEVCCSMSVLSVDLASKDYADFGFCLLTDRPIRLEFPAPNEIGLAGKPSPHELARVVSGYCLKRSVSVLLIDGPQGWRWPQSPIGNMRLCERVLNTPARTGSPGEVKPATYLAFVRFSIDLFGDLQREHGWSLLVEGWSSLPDRPWLAETFPSAAWSLLGLPRLPGKAKMKGMDLGAWREGLSEVTGLEVPAGLSHDQLQAAVTVLAGQAIADRDATGIILSGIDPIISPEGVVYEGLIALPCIRQP
jgi:hypothetical protein